MSSCFLPTVDNQSNNRHSKALRPTRPEVTSGRCKCAGALGLTLTPYSLGSSICSPSASLWPVFGGRRGFLRTGLSLLDSSLSGPRSVLRAMSMREPNRLPSRCCQSRCGPSQELSTHGQGDGEIEVKITERWMFLTEVFAWVARRAASGHYNLSWLPGFLHTKRSPIARRVTVSGSSAAR